MITNFKIFEDQNVPQRGDYVIANDQRDNDFMCNFIGLIVGYNDNDEDVKLYGGGWVYNCNYLVKYQPDDIEIMRQNIIFPGQDFVNNIRAFRRYEIKYFSSDLNDVEAYIKTKKFNL